MILPIQVLNFGSSISTFKEKKMISFLRPVHQELNTAMRFDDEIFDIFNESVALTDTERKEVDGLEEFLWNKNEFQSLMGNKTQA